LELIHSISWANKENDTERSEKFMKKRYIVLIVLALLLIVGGITVRSFMMKTEEGLEKLSSLTIKDPNLNLLTDGIYKGEYETFPVKVKVEVHIKDHKIETIVLVEHRQGRGKDAEALLKQIVDQQSVELDAVTGATYSSMIILKAVEQALNP
jgi:uncharacterized protein with FMN-binding domain